MHSPLSVFNTDIHYDAGGVSLFDQWKAERKTDIRSTDQ